MNELVRLLRYTRPYTAPVLASVFLMAIAGAAHALIALLIKPVFDYVLDPAAPNVPVQLFTLLGRAVYLNDLVPGWIGNVWTMVAFCILMVFITKGVCEYLGNYLVNYAGYSAITDLRQEVFDRVLRQDAAFYEQNSTGQVMSSIMNDIEKIQVAVSHMLADWLRQSFAALGLLYVVFQTDWKLALVSSPSCRSFCVPTVRIGKRIRRTTRKAQDHAAELNQILQETLSGHVVVKSFQAEQHESRRFRAAALRLKASNLRYIANRRSPRRSSSSSAPHDRRLLTYARNQIKAGAMTTGEFTSFVIALLMLYEPVKRLTGITTSSSRPSAPQKVFEYLDRQASVAEKDGAIGLPGFRDSVVYDNVYFRYPNAKSGFTVSGIEFDVKAGAVVALVGPSGAGKTTLTNLLARFHDVNAGRILIDGHDIRDLTLKSLRRLIAYVAQDTFLFNETASSNIRYGRREASEEEVRQAARNAMAEEFILELPDGYDTIIGERGAKLSGGQRQRIAIARALLKNAPILVLDEATSHLDTESEMLVQRALSNLMAGRTVFVIAHRLSTIRRADKIVVVENGRIQETGRHEELLHRGGTYQRLHELQFLEADPLANP
jgi:ATP-binding cassette, subfamily B, bacterial MsbA